MIKVQWLRTEETARSRTHWTRNGINTICGKNIPGNAQMNASLKLGNNACILCENMKSSVLKKFLSMN